MRGLAACLVLVLAGQASQASAGNVNRSTQRRRLEERQVRSVERLAGEEPVFWFLPPSGTGAPTVTDLCAAASSAGLLSGSWACLQGDGTAYSGSRALTAVGGPTTQAMAYCPNGLNCASVTRVVLSGTAQHYETAAAQTTTGDFSVCAVVNPTASVSNVELLSKWGANMTWRFEVQSGAPRLYVQTGGGDESSTAANGSWTERLDELWCATYDFVADTTSVATTWVNGVSNAANTTMRGPLRDEAEVLSVGARGDATQALNGRLRGALYTEAVLTSGQMAALATAVLGSTMTGSKGEALTFARTSTTACAASDGALTYVGAGRPCVGRGGYQGFTGYTALLLRSEELGHAAWTATNVTVTSNTTLAPDGTTTADTTESTVAGGYLESTAFTPTGGGFLHATIHVRDGAVNGRLVLRDTTAGADKCAVIATAAASWGRVDCDSTFVDGNNHVIRWYPGNVAGTGSAVAWGAMAAVYANTAVYVPYVRVEGTPVARSTDFLSVATTARWPLNTGRVAAAFTPDWEAGGSGVGFNRLLSCNTGGSGWDLLISGSTGVLRMDTGSGAHSPATSVNWLKGTAYAVSYQWVEGGNFTATRDGTAMPTVVFAGGVTALDAACYLGSYSTGTNAVAGPLSNLQVWR